MPRGAGSLGRLRVPRARVAVVASAEQVSVAPHVAPPGPGHTSQLLSRGLPVEAGQGKRSPSTFGPRVAPGAAIAHLYDVGLLIHGGHG